MAYVTYGGKPVNPDVVPALNRLQRSAPTVARGLKRRITQGAGNYYASKGTHTTGEALDFHTRGMSEAEKERAVAELNSNGFSAILRRAGEAGPIEHIHAALYGKSNSASIERQKGGAEAWRPIVSQLAAKYGVPEDIAMAVMRAESGGNPRARSGAGAVGLFQLMPGTARQYGVKNPVDGYQSARAGVRYLADLNKRFGSWELTLAAYNAGPGNVRKYKGIPPFKETQNYVQKVLGMAKMPQAPTERPGASEGYPVVSATPAQAVEPGKFDPFAFMQAAITPSPQTSEQPAGETFDPVAFLQAGLQAGGFTPENYYKAVMG